MMIQLQGVMIPDHSWVLTMKHFAWFHFRSDPDTPDCNDDSVLESSEEVDNIPDKFMISVTLRDSLHHHQWVEESEVVVVKSNYGWHKSSLYRDSVGRAHLCICIDGHMKGQFSFWSYSSLIVNQILQNDNLFHFNVCLTINSPDE